MAIAHYRSKIISQGVSPVAAAAYRHRTRMHDKSLALSWTFSAKSDDLAHAELALPADAPAWMINLVAGLSPADASEALWNAVAAAETRADAQTAREIVVALPNEFTLERNIELVRAYVATHLTDRGFVTDWVLHNNPGNPHIHIMHTVRPLWQKGFGAKRIALLDDSGNKRRDDKGTILYRHYLGGKDDLIRLRHGWAETVNAAYARAGLDVTIDMRSYAERDIDLLPGTHNGPKITAAIRAGQHVFKTQREATEHEQRAADIARNPAGALTAVTQQQSTFTEQDLARIIHRHVDDNDFSRVFDAARTHPSLVLLKPDGIADPLNPERTNAVYTTRDMLNLEHQLAERALTMNAAQGFAIAPEAVARAVAVAETATSGAAFTLSSEQRHAIEHITGAGQIANVVGLAGAGKTTMLDAARRAWQANGARVTGAALAGKAAKGLQDSAQIPSRTIAAWEHAWSKGNDLPRAGDVIVLDEAGMASSRQIARLIDIAHSHGAKLVLVGDPQQLQPINAGAAFRAITEQIGFAELAEVRRQSQDWQRDATRAFARGDVTSGIAAYRSHGAILPTETTGQAIEHLAAAWHTRVIEHANPDAARDVIVLAHRNAEADQLNQLLRHSMASAGRLSNPIAFQTERGAREFATGDRVLLLKNGTVASVGGDPVKVQNGTLGTVLNTDGGRLSLVLDTGATAVIDAAAYNNLDHGYATTIHKSQGVTVDTSLVLATPGMDQHAAYVAFSRHRHDLQIFAPQEGFHDTLEATIGRRNAKSTTLDYRNSDAYRDAFAVRRGLDPMFDWIALRAAVLHARRIALDAASAALQRAIDAIKQTLAQRAVTQSRPAEPALRGTPRRPRTVATGKPDSKEHRMSATATATKSDTYAFKSEVAADTAHVSFNYDKDANTILAAEMRPTPITFNKDKGTWDIKLAADQPSRERQLTKLAIAETKISTHFSWRNKGVAMANEIVASPPSQSNDISLSVRSGALAVKIPPVREAIDQMKDVGATWVPKNGENGNYWRIQLETPDHKSQVEQAIGNAGEAITRQSLTKSAIADISSTHPSMHVSHGGNTLFVEMPQMTGANAILKEEGPGQATWNQDARAWAIQVTPDALDAIKGRLARVADHFDDALVPPSFNRPGIESPSVKMAAQIEAATPQTYANNDDTKNAIDTMGARIERALSKPELAELQAPKPDAGYQSQRLANLDEGRIREVTLLVTKVHQVQSEGLKQVLAQEQAKAQSQGQGRGM